MSNKDLYDHYNKKDPEETKHRASLADLRRKRDEWPTLVICIGCGEFIHSHTRTTSIFTHTAIALLPHGRCVHHRYPSRS